MTYTNWAIAYGNVKYAFDDVDVVSWDIAGHEFRVDDADNPRYDGRTMGVDLATPGDILIDVIIRARGKTREERFATAQRARSRFTKAWAASDVRYRLNEVAELTVAGLAMVEGRPREIDWDESKATFGIIRGTARFVRTSLDTYMLDNQGNAVWSQVNLSLASAPIGGLRAPLRSPLRTAVETTQTRPVVVRGDTPASPIIEFKGPVQSGARIERPGKWRLYLNRGIAANQTVRIDTRGGNRAATYLNNKPVQILDPRSSLLSECILSPGSNVVALRGISFDGTVQVTVRWRNTTEVF